MRTEREYHCTDFAHFWVHFPAMFRNLVRELAASINEKCLKYGLFEEAQLAGSHLDLGRFTKVTPAFFLVTYSAACRRGCMMSGNAASSPANTRCKVSLIAA
jgi:hypothetical protein